MKKLLCALLLVVLLATAATAERIGTLSRLNGSEAQFKKIVTRIIEAGPALLAPGFEDISVRFYDSMISMQIALEAGEIDSLELPECVGKYLLMSNPQYTLRGVVHLTSTPGMCSPTPTPLRAFPWTSREVSSSADMDIAGVSSLDCCFLLQVHLFLSLVLR